MVNLKVIYQGKKQIKFIKLDDYEKYIFDIGKKTNFR